MSWWVAGAMAVKAGSEFLGSQRKAKDMKEAARDSMLTARYNINQRKLEDRQTQFAILEQGHQAASNIQRSADQAVGTATATAGGSGAIVESGTPRAVLTNIAQEGLHAQMGAILNTKNAIKAQARQTEAHNKTEWNQASVYSKGLSRDAKRTMDNARTKFAVDVGSAVAGGYAKGITPASTTDKVIKGAQVAKGMGETARGSTIPKARIPTQGRPSRDRSNDIIKGSWTASTRRGGPGSMGGPLGGGRMRAKGWYYPKYTPQGLLKRPGSGYSWQRKAGRY